MNGPAPYTNGTASKMLWWIMTISGMVFVSLLLGGIVLYARVAVLEAKMDAVYAGMLKPSDEQLRSWRREAKADAQADAAQPPGAGK